MGGVAPGTRGSGEDRTGRPWSRLPRVSGPETRGSLGPVSQRDRSAQQGPALYGAERVTLPLRALLPRALPLGAIPHTLSLFGNAMPIPKAGFGLVFNPCTEF